MAEDQAKTDLPDNLAAPARRALDGAGYRSLENLTRVHEEQVLDLHGMGPKAMESLRQAMRNAGLDFAEED